VSVNSANIVHSVNKVVNPHKDNYHYVGGVPHSVTDTSKYLYASTQSVPEIPEL
jgi:hypothetical protein